MNDRRGWPRREVLVSGAAVTGGIVLAAMAGNPAEAAVPGPAAKSQTGPARKSQNGWPIVGPEKSATTRIEGTDARLTLLAGPVSAILLHVARRFHYEVRALSAGDVHGYLPSGTAAAPPETNYRSGTAIAIAPGLYPAGTEGNFFPLQVLTIRDILAECGGVVRWGGDDRARPAEGHFQIDVPAGDARLTDFAGRLTRWAAAPGLGAGATPDLLDPARRADARALERRQRPS